MFLRNGAQRELRILLILQNLQELQKFTILTIFDDSVPLKNWARLFQTIQSTASYNQNLALLFSSFV